MQKYFFTICLFVLAFNGFSQTTDTFPAIDNSDLADAKFQPARKFTGESLFGYIDGGAELYLEYGFSSAWVSEITIRGGKYKTEIYRMTGPEEAFGIFSASRYKCRNIPAVFDYTCQTRYQLQICAGSFYISIINSSGNAADSAASLRIGEAIVHRIGEPSADLSSFLPGIPRSSVNASAILAKGKLGIINGAPRWEDFFLDASGFQAVIYPAAGKTLLSLKFATRGDMENFASLHKWVLKDISSASSKTSEGESIRMLSENHLLIEIPDQIPDGL